MTGDVRVTRTDSGVAFVVIDRPQRRNALAEQTMDALTGAVLGLGGDPGVRAVILSGDGTAFCAGIDITYLNSLPPEHILDQGVAFYGRPQSMVRALLDLDVPTIAAIDGPAVGLGLDLALACDSRLVGPGGWLRQGWGGASLIPATGGVLTLSAAAPGALWRLLDGQPKIDGALAERLGIAEVAAPSALAAATARAERYAAMSPSAVRGYVELSRAPVRAALDAHLARTAQIQLSLFAEGRYRSELASKIAP